MINIDDLVGIRYKTNGRSIQEGFDCYGLAIEVEKRFGHSLPDLDEIKRMDRDIKSCEELCVKQTNAILIDFPKTEGDVLFMKDGAGVMNHIGVYLGDGRFIHCNKHGVHLEKVAFYKHMIGKVFTWQ